MWILLWILFSVSLCLQWLIILKFLTQFVCIQGQNACNMPLNKDLFQAPRIQKVWHHNRSTHMQILLWFEYLCKTYHCQALLLFESLEKLIKLYISVFFFLSICLQNIIFSPGCSEDMWASKRGLISNKSYKGTEQFAKF